MSRPPIAAVGHGNIAGNILNNVGNQNVQNIYTGPQKGKALAMLESNVAFDALLNSKARYPAPKCHVDTRIAAQGVVTDWICGRGGWAEKGIMWISGAPGVGKSAIVQTVCEMLDTDDGSKTWLTRFGFRGDRKVDGSYFFCRGLGDREKASFFPATIAFQLSRSSSTCRDFIKKVIKAQPDILSKAFPSQFRHLLTATAKKRWPFQSPITIVIDALDECDNLDDQVELLKLILEAVTTTKMRFLIASRPEHQIHTFFQRDDVSQHTYHVRLDEETFNTSRDIEIFLRAEFARIRREKPESCRPLPNGEDWPGNVIIIRIRDDSDSQFIFPTLAIAFIDTPFYSPDQQLRILLSAPPPRAFSKLDALYERILSRCPPDLREGRDDLLEYQSLVKAILAVIITWSEPLSGDKIAKVLGREADVVQTIVLGPMRSLFKFDPSKLNSSIMPCHKSLRDYLLDIERSHKYFISSGEADALFINILSRSPPSDRSYPQDDLRSILVVIANWPEEVKTVSRIAEILGVHPHVVQSVVLDPSHALFHEHTDGNIQFSAPSLKAFLHDDTRSGDFFIQAEDLDTIFTRILSLRPPSDPLHSYCRDDLLDVLTAVMLRDRPTTESEIKASLLGVDINIVRRVVLGPARALFHTSNGKIQFSTSSLRPFLQDITRSREFHIRGRDETDAIFIRILSRNPPSRLSRSYSREVLVGVLSVVVERGNGVKVPEIASFLDVAPSIVKGVVFGPAKALFKLDRVQDVDFSFPSFRGFLLDANRAGEFFISRDRMDTHFTRILSRQLSSDPSRSYSREVLIGVLNIVVERGSHVKVPESASFLDVTPSLVKNVVLGPAKALFRLDEDRDVRFFIPSFKDFLLDASRAGEFFISRDKMDALFTQLLSRQPPSDPSQSYSREVLMGVLSIVVERGNYFKVPQIASFLDVATSLVEGVVFGPAKLLFTLNSYDNVDFSMHSFEEFLLDANRAGEYFIPRDNPLDARYTQILSRQPPSHPSQSYSREVLMGVLSVVVAHGGWVKVPEIASFLEVASSVVEGVVFGPAKALFKLDWRNGVDFSIPSPKEFLVDANRAGEYFISRDNPLDARYTQILSRQPSSDPSRSYSREVLMGVLSVVVERGNHVTVPQIASFLEVAPSVVEGVVFGPIKALFELDSVQDIDFSMPSFKGFLMDANRAGEYHIPPKDLKPNYKSMDAKIRKTRW